MTSQRKSIQAGELRRFKNDMSSDQNFQQTDHLAGKIFFVLKLDQSNWSLHVASVIIDGQRQNGWPCHFLEVSSVLVEESD